VKTAIFFLIYPDKKPILSPYIKSGYLFSTYEICGKYWFHLHFFIANFHVLTLFIPKTRVRGKKIRLSRGVADVFGQNLRRS
jgi:hypothetical protein